MVGGYPREARGRLVFCRGITAIPTAESAALWLSSIWIHSSAQSIAKPSVGRSRSLSLVSLLTVLCHSGARQVMDSLTCLAFPVDWSAVVQQLRDKS
jgi:hypothetical protein